MKNDRPVSNIFDLGAGRYPHMKMTRERFPRLLATRRIEEDDAEYFGAFLTKTAVRILIDFLNRTFRLRTCDLDLDGTFPAPCTQYYRKRCLAPCVAALCSDERYNESARYASLFLANERTLLVSALNKRIEHLSGELDFEQAAHFRDVLMAIEKYWQQKRWQVWLDDAIDTFAVEDTAEGFAIFLVTHRGRNVLGRKVFTVSREETESSDLAFAQIIDDFYRFHVPKEIRVSRDFVGRRHSAKKLEERFQQPVKIVVVNPATKTVNAARGLVLNRDEHELDKAKPLAPPAFICASLKKIFGLENVPKRIEAFDVAHISGTGFVAASSVWESGRFLSNEYLIVLPNEKNRETELQKLANAVMLRLSHPSLPTPDLILLDGGRAQLSSVRRQWKRSDCADVPLIGAVKPRGQHSAVSHFLKESGERIDFNRDDPSHALLQVVRDEAHDLANRTHRDYREMIPFYELLGGHKPVIVPIRYHAENGGAEDLRPIEAR